MWSGRPLVNALLAIGLIAMHFSSPAAADRSVRIVAFGDSLTAGYQLAPQEAFPAQLETALRARGHKVEIVNAGVSGDTTAAGLERLAWAVPDGADAAIVELGANDALRGLDPAAARRNLHTIVARLKAMRLDVLLAGMTAPRNWGDAYVRSFDAIFPDLARQEGLLLYPFFLEGVALQPSLNLSDGLHPNARGVAVIVERILPAVEQLIARVAARRKGGTG